MCIIWQQNPNEVKELAPAETKTEVHESVCAHDQFHAACHGQRRGKIKESCRCSRLDRRLHLVSSWRPKVRATSALSLLFYPTYSFKYSSKDCTVCVHGPNPTAHRDFRPFLFFITSWNILSLTLRLEFTEKKGANRIKIGPQLKSYFNFIYGYWPQINPDIDILICIGNIWHRFD